MRQQSNPRSSSESPFQFSIQHLTTRGCILIYNQSYVDSWKPTTTWTQDLLILTMITLVYNKYVVSWISYPNWHVTPRREAVRHESVLEKEERFSQSCSSGFYEGASKSRKSLTPSTDSDYTAKVEWYYTKFVSM